ncbi:hypothetical protein KVV02_008146 [Mortierella alpina]|uniref:Uncharacterized protein n=1 Tax=Mortierella alpina TaxID=64518 RepID=A0A9P8A1T2_MORAP|nr:hypothetical protein KVV02_008146 [Mortierella alpina]
MTHIPHTATAFAHGNAWDSSRLKAKDGWILDPQNRVVILHGINVSGGTKMPFYQAFASEAAAAAAAPSKSSKSTTAQAFYGAAPSTTGNSASGTSASSSSANATDDANIMSTTCIGEVPNVIYSYKEEHFYEHRHVSFVNRPFTLQEAGLHFERLARWGCQCLRILVPWEALEHTGPGIYDEDYIDYLLSLLQVAAKYNLKCFLDPHVDCWSRFTGGCGMPGWTLELAGIDMKKLDQTAAAVVHNTQQDKDDFPKMIWATNNIKLAAATMYTLFFAGQVFAPRAMVPLSTTVLNHLRRLHSTVVSDEAYRRGVDGGIRAPSPVQNLISIPRADHEFVQRGQVNIQHFLQGHYMEAFAYLAKRIHDHDTKALPRGEVPLIASGTVMGFETMNEPSPGYLNHPDLNKLLELADLQIGTCPTPVQGMELAQGRQVKCQVWHTGSLGPMKKGSVEVNAEGANLWRRPYWRVRGQHQHQHQTVHPPTAPPLSGTYSPFDVVSELDIASADAPSPKTTAGWFSRTAASEAHLSKAGWPEPAGYSDVCLWAEHEVWDHRTGKLLKPNYFERIPTEGYIPPGFQPGREVEWKQDFWLPFVNTFSLRIRQEDPRYTVFVEPPVNEAPPMFRLNKILIGGAADQVKNMFRAMTSWGHHRTAFPTQHTSVVSRRAISRSVVSASDHGSQVGDGGSDLGVGKGKAPVRPLEEDLHDNACQHPIFDPMGDVSENIVVAPHFYDGYTNITRDFVPFTLDFLGYKRGVYWSLLGALKLSWTGVEGAWKDQVKGIESDIRFAMGHQHGILMGETGLPMDLFKKASFNHRYGTPKQTFAMKLLLDAMDESMMSFTLWNYCPDNSHYWGDRWNGEDFSIWCPPSNEFEAGQAKLEEEVSTAKELVKAAHSGRGMGSSLTLTEIAADVSSSKEQSGCHEGCIWWLCLPKSNVWTTRTAPKRMVVVSVAPPSSTAPDRSRGMVRSSATPAPTLETWQDLLPLSLQIERSRSEFYAGLRAGETFIRAYPLAIWGEPIQYRFEPGRPVSDSELLSKDLVKKKTGDVASWENRFFMYFELACDRHPKRDRSHHEECHGDNISPAAALPSTDVFLPRFHFPLDSPVGADHFESLNIVQEMREQVSQAGLAGHQPRQPKREKGRWHRFDVRVTDGHFQIRGTQQLLQYWTETQPAFNQNDNLASTAEFFERVEHRIRALFTMGWDGVQGITTSVEQKWIKTLWHEMQRADADAESSVLPSLFACLLPCFSRRLSDVENEERKKLKLKELQQKWRERVGLPAKGVAFCHRCGQLEVMHVHGITATMQVWSGYRG